VLLDDALELLHFGFRGIVLGPDNLLARRKLGRVHHRILYMVRRNHGLSIGELVAVLGVTKQALHRPLGDLARAGMLTAEPDPADRRTRRLTLTAKGRSFEHELSQRQRAAFARAFAAVGNDGAKAWARIMSLIGNGQTSARLAEEARAARPRARRA
jgi:DNA-binding MarR family transcriptional regulator